MRTIAALWRRATTSGRTRPAYMAEDDGGWREVSWAEAGSTVDELANGLLALGVRKGDAFAILARTSLEWALFDFALALVGAVAAPIYSNSSARDCGYILEHSEAIGVLAEDEEQLAKIDPDGNARLEHVLSDELEARIDSALGFPTHDPHGDPIPNADLEWPKS